MPESSNILTDALPMMSMPGEGLAASPRVRDGGPTAVGLAEHSNVTGKVLVSSYLREGGPGFCSDVPGPPYRMETVDLHVPGGTKGDS
jgi:hypothetical protein